jgi:hypothetical protein
MQRFPNPTAERLMSAPGDRILKLLRNAFSFKCEWMPLLSSSPGELDDDATLQ